MPSPRSSASAVQRTVCRIACALGLWLAGWPAQALEMVALQADGIGRVLLLRDCEQRPGKTCKEYENQVYDGDGQRLEAELGRNKYAEVWLHSTGGHSIEGPRLGDVFRRHGMAVRVRQGHSCASACTVAFLGGVIRTIDPGASYHVHAPSGVRNAIREELMRRLLASPESELEREVLALHAKARQTVFERLQYVQQMLGGRPDVQAYRALQSHAQTARPPYLASPQFAADVARIRTEGPAAVHTVVMSNERAAYDEVLARLQPQVATLGLRAAAAHRMVETMFSTTIIRTADLTPEVLVKLGFVTPVLGQ